MKLTLYEHLYLIVKYRLRGVFYHTLVSCQVDFFIYSRLKFLRPR